MPFNPNPSKQAPEAIFSLKTNKVYHPPLLFTDPTVQQISTPRHSGIHLDEKLTFKHHINEKTNKVNTGIGIICRLSNILPPSALLIIYRSFVRPFLDYGILSMISQKMNRSVVKLNQLNTMRLWS